jgi:hypothetical protein
MIRKVAMLIVSFFDLGAVSDNLGSIYAEQIHEKKNWGPKNLLFLSL